jgi:hypothetical protein
MLIEFNFGPHAGQSEHIPDTAVAALLVKAGVLKLVEETPQPKTLHPANAVNTQIENHPQPLWTVRENAYGTPVISLKTGQGTELVYMGKPEDAQAHFQPKRTPTFSRFAGAANALEKETVSGYEVPQDILAAYTRLYNRPDPEALAEQRRNAGQR